MGPADSAKPQEDAQLQTAAGNPSPPPDRKSPSPQSKSPSPGSASGTTRSASPADPNPLEPAEESRNPGASPSRPADPTTWQDLADAISNGPVVNPQQPFAANAAPHHSTVLQGQGSLAHSAAQGKGQRLSSGCPVLDVQKSLRADSTQMQKGLYNVNASGGIPNGFGDCEQQCLPPVIKIEVGGGPAQHAQHANKVFVKSEQAESDAQGGALEEEAGRYRQSHWQTASQTQHAPYARQPTNNLHPYSTTGYAYSSQTPSHAHRLSAADAEAQLFFMPHSSVPLPAAAMMAPNSSGFVVHPSAFLQQQHLHAQQRYYRQQQLQKQQWLAQQHYHQQMLMHQQQQQQQQQPRGFSREPQFEALKPGQTVRIVHPHKHLPVPSMASAQHAQHAMQASASHPPPAASQNSNGLPSSACDSFGSQHAQHGANGFSNQQQGASGSLPHQKGQHAKQGANRVSQPSMRSMDPQRRSGSGPSTAFIIWCDAQYKARGQVEKRAALRSFVQAAKVALPSTCPSFLPLSSSSVLTRICIALNKFQGCVPWQCSSCEQSELMLLCRA